MEARSKTNLKTRLLARSLGWLASLRALKNKVCLFDFDFVFRFVWLLFENVRNKKNLLINKKYSNPNNYLNAVVASRDTSILHFNIGRWMSEFAFSVRS